MKDDKIYKEWFAEQMKGSTKIKNPLANSSTRDCVNCERKTRYILELERENEELKKTIKELKENLDLMRRLP